MLNLLAPAALLGLLALAVPAILHLRRPPPPTVHVGTLRHLEGLPRLRPRWWRWRDRARLALRLALLSLLTLALTRPLWRRAADRSPRRWSLVDPAGALTGASRERLEARRAAGDEVRSLAPAGATADLWSTLRELDAQLPAGSSLTVFSPARLDALRGERPTLGNVTVEWVETPAAVDPSPAPSNLVARTESALRVVILHAPERAEDARRLASAIRTATPPGGPHPEAIVEVNPGPAEPAATPDWVFCLGGPRPESAWVRTAHNLFTDASDAPPNEEGPPPGRLVAPEIAGISEVLLRRRVLLGDDPVAAVHWTDSLGLPVLTVTPPDAAGQRRWRFGSRFDPAWNDLPGTTALTETLRAWFFPPNAGAPDPRLAGAVQASPRTGTPGDRPAWPWPGEDNARPAVDLRPWALALATLGFLLERLWAHRRPATSVPS